MSSKEAKAALKAAKALTKAADAMHEYMRTLSRDVRIDDGRIRLVKDIEEFAFYLEDKFSAEAA